MSKKKGLTGVLLGFGLGLAKGNGKIKSSGGKSQGSGL